MEVTENMFRRNGFRRRPSFDLPKPVEVGKEYDVEIAEVGNRGDGIARLSNFVIFVPNTQKGDKVKVKINSVARSFAVAEKVGEAEGETGEKTEEQTQEKKEEAGEAEEASEEAAESEEGGESGEEETSEETEESEESETEEKKE